MVVSNTLETELSTLQKRKLMKLFGMYDANNTGTLYLSDFEHIANRLAKMKGWRQGGSDYHRLMDKLMHRWIHLRSEVKATLGHRPAEFVTLDEWLHYYEQVLKDDEYRAPINEIEDLIFEAVDADASGSLELQEWQSLFQIYGIPVIYAEEAFAKIDQNQDGCLSREELLPLIEEFYYSDDPRSPGNYIFGPL